MKFIDSGCWNSMHCSIMIIFISPIMVVQNQPKKNKIKYKYLINLTREKIEITNNIHYNMLRNVKKMFSA